MKRENEVFEKNLEQLLKNALSPCPANEKKAVLYQRLLLLQQNRRVIADFPVFALFSFSVLFILLSVILFTLILSYGISSTILPGFWLVFLLLAGNFLMIPVAGYIVVKRRQNA